MTDPTPEEIRRVDDYRRRQTAVAARDAKGKAFHAQIENRIRIRDLLTGKTIVGVSVVDPVDYLVGGDFAECGGLGLVLGDGTVVSVTSERAVEVGWKSVAS